MNTTPFNFLSIDTETSGADPFSADILYISLIPINFSAENLNVYIKPSEITWGSKNAKDYFLVYAKEWEANAMSDLESTELIHEYIQNIKGPVMLIGHNVGFDFSFLKKLFSKNKVDLPKNLSYRSLDTHSLMFFYNLNKNKKMRSFSLEESLDCFSIKHDHSKRHTAYEDALAVKKIFEHLFSWHEKNKSD